MTAQDIRNAGNVPRHVGIIMDGNGRWAAQRKLPRSLGHKEGVPVAKKIIDAAVQCGVSYVTLYTFSTENWKRAQEEVGFLFGLLMEHLRSELAFYSKNKVRVMHTGNIDGLPKEIQHELHFVQNETASFTGLTVSLAINYGGRDEIIRAIHRAQKRAITMTEANFASFFDVSDLPDMDLLIRTGGEKRLSNFMLWHSAYAEIIFSEVLWPDYTMQCFFDDIETFQKRNRRFGGVI